MNELLCNDLEKMMFGITLIDVNDWRLHTNYMNEDIIYVDSIEFFWKVLSELT